MRPCPSLWQGAAGIAVSWGFHREVHAAKQKSTCKATAAQGTAPVADTRPLRPGAKDITGGLSSSSRAEIHPGFNVLQKMVDHNAALKNMRSEGKENNGKKYSRRDMMDAAKAVNLPMSQATLTRLIHGDTTVGCRTGPPRLLPDRVDQDLAKTWQTAQEAGVGRTQGWLSEAIGEISTQHPGRHSSVAKPSEERVSAPRPSADLFFSDHAAGVPEGACRRDPSDAAFSPVAAIGVRRRHAPDTGDPRSWLIGRRCVAS